MPPNSITQEELQQFLADPPEELAPLAGMLRNVAASRQNANHEVALAEERRRHAKRERDAALDRRHTLAAQHEALAAAWRQMVVAYKARLAGEHKPPAPIKR